MLHFEILLIYLQTLNSTQSLPEHIDDLAAENNRLACQLSELKETSQKEISLLQAASQSPETDTQGLSQQVQELTFTLDFLRSTVTRLVRLKLELNNTLPGGV